VHIVDNFVTILLHWGVGHIGHWSGGVSDPHDSLGLERRLEMKKSYPRKCRHCSMTFWSHNPRVTECYGCGVDRYYRERAMALHPAGKGLSAPTAKV
jgi:hypothetical protein